MPERVVLRGCLRILSSGLVFNAFYFSFIQKQGKNGVNARRKTLEEASTFMEINPTVITPKSCVIWTDTVKT